MKFTPEVTAALATLRANAENDFERHRIDVLERDLTTPLNIGTETWKYFGQGYQISTLGRVKSFKRYPEGQIRRPGTSPKGYLKVVISINGERTTCPIHRLVAEAFIPNPENKHCVNHINGNKADNRVENLEWVTESENVQHAHDIGLKIEPQGEKHTSARFTKEQILWIRHIHKPYDKACGTSALARRFNVSQSTIYKIIRQQSYRNVVGS